MPVPGPAWHQVLSKSEDINQYEYHQGYDRCCDHPEIGGHLRNSGALNPNPNRGIACLLPCRAPRLSTKCFGSRDPDQIRPKLAERGRASPDVNQHSGNVGRSWPVLANGLAKNGQKVAKLGHAQSLVDNGQSWQELSMC